MTHEEWLEHQRYNCEDCVRTFEIAQVEKANLASMRLEAVNDFQHQLFPAVLSAMLRGVRIDTVARAAMAKTLRAELRARSDWFERVLTHPLNPRSNKQMKDLFYHDLKQKVILKRSTGNPTLDDEALAKLCAREPLVRPLVRRITEYRSIGVFLNTFIDAELDADERMRCSYNICGTETYRFSSGANAFGSGTNLQNIPKGTKAKEADDLELPNIRKIFIPDPGYTFFDMDLDRADLQVVVWEADDLELKQALKEGVDIHALNAKTLGITRQLAKSWVHGTNYGGGPRTMAQACGITVRTAEAMQRRWMEAHPGIKRWHERVHAQLISTRTVTNKFGYRRFYFDRVEGLLPEALAWIPQSTVACVINRAWVNIHRNLPDVHVLLQVHDSLAGQFRTGCGRDNCKSNLLEQARVTIPYDDPLVIPVNIKTSEVSWGDCE